MATAANAEFESLYREHYDRLYTLAFRILGGAEDAEDAVQTCFAQAYAAYASFRGESAAYTWLYRILVNVARRRAKTRSRLPIEAFAERRGIEVDEAFVYVRGFGRSEDEALCAMIRESCLQMFMDCMPARYRAVFTLMGVLGFTAAECAAVLGIAEGSARVYLARARKLTRAHFNERCSLIKPGAACSCRAFAAFRKRLGLQGLPQGIASVLSREQLARERFEAEAGELLDLKRLYATRFDPGSYEEFLGRVRGLAADGAMRVLGGRDRLARAGASAPASRSARS